MNQERLHLLLVNRLLRREKKPIDLYERYQVEGFDLIVFPWREDKLSTEIVFFDNTFAPELERLFNTGAKARDGIHFLCFDLEFTQTTTFIDNLRTKFELMVSNITDFEKVR